MITRSNQARDEDRAFQCCKRFINSMNVCKTLGICHVKGMKGSHCCFNAHAAGRHKGDICHRYSPAPWVPVRITKSSNLRRSDPISGPGDW